LVTGEGAFVSDDLRLSGQAAADRVAGAEVLGNDAYVLDSLRLSGQAENFLDAALIPREGAMVSDDLNTSGQAAAERVAGTEVLGDDAYVLDSARISGQALNEADGTLLTDTEAASLSDEAQADAEAAADDVTGAEALGDGADVPESSGQAPDGADDELHSDSGVESSSDKTQTDVEASGADVAGSVVDQDSKPLVDSAVVKVQITEIVKVVLGRFGR
jgi:hypothetical protein